MTTKKKATKATSTKAKTNAKPKKPATQAQPAPAVEATTPYPGFEAYDVVQVSDEGSSTWSDFDSIRTTEEGEQARKMCELTGPRTYRIVSGDKQMVKVPAPDSKAKAATKAMHAKATKNLHATEALLPATENKTAIEAPESVEGSLSESFREAGDIHGISDPRAQDAKPATNATGSKKLSALDAAAQVLATTGEAMNCQEMVAAIREGGLWTSPGGKTPHATLHAAISTEIRKRGENARFAKSTRGKFTLRSTTRPAPARTPPTTTQATPTAPVDDTPADGSDGPESMSELFRFS